MRRMSAAIQFAGRKPENRPWTGGRFQADSFHQFVEILDYALIEEVDLRSPFLFQLAVTCDGAKLPTEPAVLAEQVERTIQRSSGPIPGDSVPGGGNDSKSAIGV